MCVLRSLKTEPKDPVSLENRENGTELDSRLFSANVCTYTSETRVYDHIETQLTIEVRNRNTRAGTLINTTNSAFPIKGKITTRIEFKLRILK